MWSRGNTATLIAGKVRPRDDVAHTPSKCRGFPVSSEDLRYVYDGDLLNVTDPEWAAQHLGRHACAPVPTLRNSPRDVLRKTRGQDGVAASFPVRLLYSLQHAG